MSFFPPNFILIYFKEGYMETAALQSLVWVHGELCKRFIMHVRRQRVYL